MPSEVDFIKTEDLISQINYRKQDMKVRDARMDLWHTMYLLIDEFQLAKPNGLVRFTSNEPRTVLDLAHTVMTRNPLKPRIPMTYAKTEQEREDYGLIEHGIRGVFHDLDRQMNKRGLPGARQTAAWHLLLRGWAASRIQLKEETHPLDYEPWDMRFVYPDFDRRGLQSVIYETLTTWGDILESFPDIRERKETKNLSRYSQDLGQWVIQYEFWDRYQSAIAVTHPKQRRGGDPRPGDRAASDLIWAQPPELHELVDEEGDPVCPIVIVPSHGLPVFATPKKAYSGLGRTPSEIMGNKPMPLPLWKQQGGWLADQGRSMLSAIEDTFQIYNEMVSLVWQVLDHEALGTFTLHTRTGEMKNIVIGSGAVNPLKLGEVLNRMPPMAASPDTYKLLAFISDQIAQGTVDQKLLRGLSEFQGSGFLHSQLENAAMNAVGPWLQSYEFWATEIAQSVLNQLHQGAGKEWTVWGEGSNRRLFKVKFGPEAVEEVIYIEMKAKPALPEDLAVRVNIAAMLANPARPLASIQTIFDRVLEWDDAQREKELLFDDIADLDPIVVMLRLTTRMVERGLPEIAQIFGDKAFVMAFAQQMMQARLMAQLSGQPPTGAGLAQPGAGSTGRPPTETPAGPQSSTLPPEMGGQVTQHMAPEQPEEEV